MAEPVLRYEVDTSARLRWALAALLATTATLVVALVVGGGSPAAELDGIPSPGALTGWGLPVVRAVADLAAVLTIGFILTAAVLLPSSGAELQGLSLRAMSVARRTAITWSVATMLLYALTVSDLFSAPLPGALRWTYMSGLFFETSLGRALVAQALIAAVVAVWCRWALSVQGTTALLGLSVAGLLPQVLSGHAADSGSHDLAVVSLGLHVLGASVWVGGLAGLTWIALHGSRRLPAGVARYSVLAAWCLAIVAASGVVNAIVRLGAIANLFTTSYGVLVLGKITAVVVLGAFGYAQRHRTVMVLRAAVDDDRPAATRAFLRLAAAELLVMAMAIALAVALSRSPTPVPDDVYANPVEQVLGGPLPVAPTLSRFVTGWAPNGVGLAVVALGAALYARGLWAMHRRGDEWPVGRTVSWGLGLAVVGWSTVGGLGLYSHVLFSAHMVSHMMLAMVAPILLVLGAPMTLALRTLPGPRQRGELAPRQLLVAFLHSRFARVVTHPLTAALLFIGSLYALYFTPLFGLLMASDLGHAAMVVHFLATGTLYYYVLIGVDPSPRRLHPFVRLGILLVTVPFHAFFAIAVMNQATVLGGDYWARLQRPYATDLLADQYLGGGIAWAMGELPLVLVMGALLVQWVRSDRRESRRYDRREAAQGDVELTAYNDYLASLARHDEQVPR